MKDSLPSHVIRYYRRHDYAMELLTKKQAALVHVSILNDPEDFPLEDAILSFDRLQLFAHYLENYPPSNLNDEKIRKMAREIEKYPQSFKDIAKKERESLYVFSTSKSDQTTYPDNSKMWREYGGCHKGVAIKFKVKADSEVLYPIHYSDKHPEITKDDIIEVMFCVLESSYEAAEQCYNCSNFSKANQKIAGTKKTKWSYENEWRFAKRVNKKDEKTLKIPQGCFLEKDNTILKCPVGGEDISVHSIYLGHDVTNDILDEWIKAIQSTSIELYRESSSSSHAFEKLKID